MGNAEKSKVWKCVICKAEVMERRKLCRQCRAARQVENDALYVPEAARELGMSASWLHNRIRSGIVPFIMDRKVATRMVRSITIENMKERGDYNWRQPRKKDACIPGAPAQPDLIDLPFSDLPKEEEQKEEKPKGNPEPFRRITQAISEAAGLSRPAYLHCLAIVSVTYTRDYLDKLLEKNLLAPAIYNVWQSHLDWIVSTLSEDYMMKAFLGESYGTGEIKKS